MVCWVSSKILSFIFKFMEILPEMKDTYQYGIEITISSIINVMLILLCFFALGDIFAGITYLAIFIFLRSYTGGYHATTYLRCNIAMVVTFIISFVLYKIITCYVFPLFICETAAIVNLIPIIIFSPVSNKHKPLNDKQRKRSYKLSLLIASTLSLIGLILYTLEIFIGAIIIITVTMVSMLIIIEFFCEGGSTMKVKAVVAKIIAKLALKSAKAACGAASMFSRTSLKNLET